ncbi:type II secretion system protein, partial [Candidatus Saccharibacteria bacterium]|nr:type II secretion system protein [Candidatus Saccharibacteria bacterium]
MKRVIKEGGFTVTEMIVTIALIGLLIVPVVETSLHFYADATSSNRKATLSLESQATIGKFTEDLRMASGVNASNLISDPNQGGGWATNSANHILVMAMPAQDSDGNFIIDPATGKLYNNEVVYYSSGTTLYRRSLPNTAASGNAMIQSCPPISATLDCPADVVMTKYFSTSTFTFYDSDGIQTADPNAAHSVEIHLETTDSA